MKTTLTVDGVADMKRQLEEAMRFFGDRHLKAKALSSKSKRDQRDSEVAAHAWFDAADFIRDLEITEAK